jgi:hypothetical protein
MHISIHDDIGYDASDDISHVDVDANVGHNVVDVICDRRDQLLEIKWNNVTKVLNKT